MSVFAGCWEQTETKNFDSYMDAVVVPEEQRKILRDNPNKLQITVEGDTWHYVSRYGDADNKVTLKLGSTVDYQTHTGVPMKGLLKSVGDKVVEEHTIGGEQKVDVEREIVNGQLCVSFTAKGVTGQILYAKK